MPPVAIERGPSSVTRDVREQTEAATSAGLPSGATEALRSAPTSRFRRASSYVLPEGVRPAPASAADSPDLWTGEGPPDPYRASLRWEGNYVRVVAAIDFFAILIATMIAFSVRILDGGPTVSPGRYFLLTVGLVAGWMFSMAVSRAYEARFLGIGSDEFKRVFNAGVRLMVAIATVSYAAQSVVGRRYVLIALPLAIVLDLLARYGARRILARLRTRDRCLHRVIVVGTKESANDLIRTTERAPYAGMRVVGACLDRPQRASNVLAGNVPVLGDLNAILTAVRTLNASTVAVTSCAEMNGPALRRLSWALEGTDVDIVVAPALTDIAGPRIHIRPVAGLPLLHIEEPELSGGRRLVKAMFDRTVGLLAVLALLPALLFIGIAVRLTSPGPALFRQTRIGRGGQPFTIYKFRSMHVDAETRLQALLEYNERSEGVLFKIRRDPRVTGIGTVLRRYSLDELPQLLNIVKGDMSLVGPRPPLPSEVEQYEIDVHRRLLVKPGLTGLWQVSGRSDLSWDEAVRLDLHYVENWSLILDFMILWRTVAAVVKGRGAY